MENMTLLIDPETRDLVLDEEGHFTKILTAIPQSRTSDTPC